MTDFQIARQQLRGNDYREGKDNQTLAWRSELYKKDGTSVSQSMAEKRLVPLKEEFPWLTEVSSVCLQQTLRDQTQAFTNFFEGRAQYPVFKKRLWLRCSSVHRVGRQVVEVPRLRGTSRP